MTIAYLDLIDSFKHFDRIMSHVIKLDNNTKIKVDTSRNGYSKIRR